MSWVSYYFIHLNYATYFRYVQKIKHCWCLRAFSVQFLAFVWSLNCISLVCKFYVLFSTMLFFAQCWYWRLFSSVIFSNVNLNSCSFFRCFFWLVNFTYQICISYHILGMGNIPFEGFLVLTFIKKCKSNRYLFL